MSREYAVRMAMSEADGAAIAALNGRLPAEVEQRVMDQLFLRTILVEQRRRIPIASRPAYEERADRILALLDPQEPSRA